MKLKDWLIAKKERRAARRRQRLERIHGTEAAGLSDLGCEASDIEAPESRFTDEYRDFLKEQESAAENGGSVSETE